MTIELLYLDTIREIRSELNHHLRIIILVNDCEETCRDLRPIGYTLLTLSIERRIVSPAHGANAHIPHHSFSPKEGAEHPKQLSFFEGHLHHSAQYYRWDERRQIRSCHPRRPP